MARSLDINVWDSFTVQFGYATLETNSSHTQKEKEKGNKIDKGKKQYILKWFYYRLFITQLHLNCLLNFWQESQSLYRKNLRIGIPNINTAVIIKDRALRFFMRYFFLSVANGMAHSVDPEQSTPVQSDLVLSYKLIAKYPIFGFR